MLARYQCAGTDNAVASHRRTFQAGNFRPDPNMVAQGDVPGIIDPPPLHIQHTVGIAGAEVDIAGKQAILANLNLGSLNGRKVGRPQELCMLANVDLISGILCTDLRLKQRTPGADVNGVVVSVNVHGYIFQNGKILNDNGVIDAAKFDSTLFQQRTGGNDLIVPPPANICA